MRSRRPLLTAAVGFARVRADTAELRPLHAWLDSWRGIGAIAVGMARQGYDLQLTQYADRGWRANFYPAGIAHSVVIGSAWGFNAVAGGAAVGVGGVKGDRPPGHGFA